MASGLLAAGAAALLRAAAVDAMPALPVGRAAGASRSAASQSAVPGCAASFNAGLARPTRLAEDAADGGLAAVGSAGAPGDRLNT